MGCGSWGPDTLQEEGKAEYTDQLQPSSSSLSRLGLLTVASFLFDDNHRCVWKGFSQLTDADVAVINVVAFITGEEDTVVHGTVPYRAALPHSPLCSVCVPFSLLLSFPRRNCRATSLHAFLLCPKWHFQPDPEKTLLGAGG